MVRARTPSFWRGCRDPPFATCISCNFPHLVFNDAIVTAAPAKNNFTTSYRISPAPNKPAPSTAARLPTTPPLAQGPTSPGAMLASLEVLLGLAPVDELDDPANVPLVRELSELTRGVKLDSEPKAAVTPVPFLQLDGCVPDPAVNLTAAHWPHGRR